MTSAAIKSELQHDLFFQRGLLFKHCGERSHLARDEYYGKLSVELTEHINVLHLMINYPAQGYGDRADDQYRDNKSFQP